MHKEPALGKEREMLLPHGSASHRLCRGEDNGRVPIWVKGQRKAQPGDARQLLTLLEMPKHFDTLILLQEIY